MSSGSRSFCACVLAAGLLSPSRAAERSDTPRIAFASHRDGNWEIYLTDADGGHQTRLTRLDPQDRFPLWSPDRTQVAFASQIGGDHWELWVIDADGANPRFLATGLVAKGHRQWSHDGKRIVFAASVDGSARIFSVEVATGKLVRLTDSSADADPSWSPDDSQIAFSSTRDGVADLYVMRADGSGLRRLTDDAAPDVNPDWSPDGTRIAFISGQGEGRDVYLVHLSDGRRERLTSGAHATNDGARWSPDGRYIAVQTAEASYDIQVVQLADHKRWTVAGSTGYDGQFSWAPASDHLAFISGRDGFNAVYVTDLTGTPRRLTTTSSLDPRWSP